MIEESFPMTMTLAVLLACFAFWAAVRWKGLE